jgi:DNA-binding LacI/PurR family transcriptional regulator
MQARTPTKNEIAQAVGVSRTCVSLVLNQSPNARISSQTRRMILEEARKRGYVSAAVNKRAVVSNSIAYIYCEFYSQYRHSISSPWPLIVQELQRLAAVDERFVTFLTTSIDAMSLQGLYRSLDTLRPLGVVLDSAVPDVLLSELKNRNIPVVVFGAATAAVNEHRRCDINTIAEDYDQSVGFLMRWLHDRGCRKIAFSCGLLRVLVHSLQFEAYRHWIDRLGLSYDPALAQFGEDATGDEIFHTLGRLGVQHDGIILSSPSRALRALPFLPPSFKGPHAIRPVGVLGAPDSARDWISDMAISGARCRDTAKAIYDILGGEFNYQTKQKKHVILPSTLVEAIR